MREFSQAARIDNVSWLEDSAHMRRMIGIYWPQLIFPVVGSSVGVVLLVSPARSLQGGIHGVPWQDCTDIAQPEDSFATGY
jgi:hypothetical protein